jgi:hypothetical protein
MKKIIRFIILAIVFALSFIVLYSLLPAIVWVFGGSFIAVSQNAAYAAVGGIIIIVALGVLFNETFDSNFQVK